MAEQNWACYTSTAVHERDESSTAALVEFHSPSPLFQRRPTGDLSLPQMFFLFWLFNHILKNESG
jgi:hypothetical protein